MPNKEHIDWRKKRIADIETGSGVTDLSLKQSVDVINSTIEDLTDSIEKSSKASGRLSLIIAICTAFLVAVGLADLCVRIFEIYTKCP
jgi:hypothetical protein